MKDIREIFELSYSKIKPSKVISAFSANIDKVVRLKKEHGKFFSEVPQELPSREVLNSCDELLKVLIAHVKEGRGAEWLIGKKDVCEKLEKLFLFSERLGGNAAHVANILSSLGFEVLLNVPRLTEKQSSLFHENVRCFDSEGNLRHPIELSGEKEDILHYIFEFIEGESLDIGGFELKFPATGRFIASYDVPSPSHYLNDFFVKFSQEYAKKAKGVFLSGFHLFRSDEGFEKFVSLIESWGSLKIHIELGDFESEKVLKRVLNEIVPLTSSLGMNELELQEVSSFFSISCGDDPKSMAYASKKLEKILNVPVVVHHPYFSFSLYEEEISLQGLALGTLFASMKAESGEFYPENLKRFISSVKPHPIGLKAVEKIENLVSAVFPSVLVKKFESSVGLGDSFSAGYFIALISR